MANFINRNKRKCIPILSYVAKALYPEKTGKVDVLPLFALRIPIKTVCFSQRVIGIYLVDTRDVQRQTCTCISGALKRFLKSFSQVLLELTNLSTGNHLKSHKMYVNCWKHFKLLQSGLGVVQFTWSKIGRIQGERCTFLGRFWVHLTQILKCTQWFTLTFLPRIS